MLSVTTYAPGPTHCSAVSAKTAVREIPIKCHVAPTNAASKPQQQQPGLPAHSKVYHFDRVKPQRDAHRQRQALGLHAEHRTNLPLLPRTCIGLQPVRVKARKRCGDIRACASYKSSPAAGLCSLAPYHQALARPLYPLHVMLQLSGDPAAAASTCTNLRC